jgi:hypothetical protein
MRRDGQTLTVWLRNKGENSSWQFLYGVIAQTPFPRRSKTDALLGQAANPKARG